MTILGLNSPLIFIILIIILYFLGPKRIEKGYELFLKLLKFLLSEENVYSKEAAAKEAAAKEAAAKEEKLIDSKKNKTTKAKDNNSLA